MNKFSRVTALLAFLSILVPLHADILIVNNDDPGVGFNDTTVVAPVGGNSATTIGAQRLAVFETAAFLWSSILEIDVDVKIRASFAPLTCSSNSAVLGSAGPLNIVSNFNNAPVSNTWYPIGLANNLVGFDLDIGGEDVVASFNGDLDNNNSCLNGINWYYGLDDQAPGQDINFLNVVMHELGHGLGFASFINVTSGALPSNRPDIYSRMARDNVSQLLFSQMTAVQRLAALNNTGSIVWTGAQTTARAAEFLASSMNLSVDGNLYSTNQANYGPVINRGGISSQVVQADDISGNNTDACQALQSANAAEMVGKIALVTTGNCAITTKVVNVQNAGAVAVLVAATSGTSPPSLSGSNNAIKIPTVGIGDDAADAIRAQLPALSIDLDYADNGAIVGADSNGFVKLYAPNPVRPGSSFSHFDTSTTPNTLMEPSIQKSLDASKSVDLTPNMFADIGWTLKDLDGDTVPDANDNCQLIANISQNDTNMDGYGNFCDADLNDNEVINFGDLALLQSKFLTGDRNADFNGDGQVNFGDVFVFTESFLQAPGPSGVTN